MLVPRIGHLIAGLLKDPRVGREHKAALAGFASRLASGAGVSGVAAFDEPLLAVVLHEGVLARLDRDVLRLHWQGDAAALSRLEAWASRLAWLVPAALKDRVLAPEDPARWLQGGRASHPERRRR